jgi:alkyl hydroperoxide reductase subunit AhpC
VATLVSVGQRTVDAHETTRDARSLRMWLRNDWAILFSHPEDFATGDLESDRWLTILRRSFADHCVRPIALAAASQQADQSWIAQVNNDVATVSLNDSFGDWTQPLDPHARGLREAIARMQHRFVMIIDAKLKPRRTYSYQDRTRLPSPLDFVGWVRVIRARESSPERSSWQARELQRAEAHAQA